MTAASITAPFDVLKTRRQMHMDNFNILKKNVSMIQIAREIMQEYGIPGFFRGIVPRCDIFL
jgi:hypothetical protein